MNGHNFDHITSRINTNSAKWNVLKNIYPMSVADMDIRSPNNISEKILEMARVGIYGYSILPKDYPLVIKNYIYRHYNYNVHVDDILFCPRIIQAISLYIREISPKDKGICIFTPSYSPVTNAILLNNRMLYECPLIFNQQRYEIDFLKLEECFQYCSTFILISPHNPTGKVFSKRELEEIVFLAEKYNVFIISDEVHADFNFSGKKHNIIAGISEYSKTNSITCISPAKTFNIPGLEIANLLINNKSIRTKMQNIMQAIGMHNPNYFAIPAIIEAYQNSDDWLEALKNYILENRIIATNFIKKELPLLSVTEEKGTYLLWVNYEGINITEQQLKEWIMDLSKIEMSWGSDFGQTGLGFFRMNIALPRALLIENLEKIKIGFILFTQQQENKNGQ